MNTQALPFADLDGSTVRSGPTAQVGGWRSAWTSVRAKLAVMLVASGLSIGVVAALGLYGMKAGEQAAEGLVREGVDTVARMGDLRTAFNGMAR